tara:strand:+ start:205 stop:594 length:390 start_codon:yes stop_codon:yes gene_type:complete
MDRTVTSAIFLIVLMFIVSGGDKVISLGKSENVRLANKLTLNQDLATAIVLLAGIYELLASGMVLYGTLLNDKHIATIGTYMLIIFTLMATLIFYVFPFKYKPFMSNMSVVAGLYLMLNICFFKSGTPS